MSVGRLLEEHLEGGFDELIAGDIDDGVPDLRSPSFKKAEKSSPFLSSHSTVQERIPLR